MQIAGNILLCVNPPLIRRMINQTPSPQYISAVIPIPSHIKPDESIPLLSPFAGKLTKARHFQEENTKPKKYVYTDISANSSTSYDI